MSETLIMSDCDTDSPDIHNKERREREREQERWGRGKVREKKKKTSGEEFFFFLWHIKSIAAESPTFWTYHIQEKSRKSKANSDGD